MIRHPSTRSSSTHAHFPRIAARLAALLLIALAVLPARAQHGDHAGESQVPPPRHFTTPPAPPLTPAQALKTFKVAPGFRIELVASEPLVVAPVAIAFDTKGRIWVCEMQAYMQDVDGHGENDETCDIAILEDSHGTGKYDKRTVFLDKLKLPRAISLARDGVFVAEPPHLWFCREKDGKMVEKIEADPAYANTGTVEHMPNGMMFAMDNYFYNAKSAWRYHMTEYGDVKREPTAFRGQWGITQDDWGRLFYNYNSDQLRGDLVPSQYLVRNRDFRDASGVNIQIVKDQSTYPIRPNPGVNRGYQKDQIRDDGTLASYTAVCGPVIYRGDLFPKEYLGAAFVCEPSGNLITRDTISDANATLTGNRVGKSEFVASTDERFRPVNAYTGPDGALWVVDINRGIIQHKVFVTSYLRGQILERKLEKPLDGGRIYRIVPANAKLGALPKLPDDKPATLVKYLSHPNGWWRDTAQRLLVESGDTTVGADLKKLATAGKEPTARLQALWTLQGLGQLDEPTVDAALSDPHPKVRAAAVRLSEAFLTETSKIAQRILKMTDDKAADVRLQLAFTLGELQGPKAEAAMTAVLQTSADNQYIRDAVVTGLQGRELEFLQSLLSNNAWQTSAPGRNVVIGNLTRCVFAEANSERVAKLLDVMTAETGPKAWRQTAMLEGLIGPPPKKGSKHTVRPVVLPSEPPALAKLAQTDDKKLQERVAKIDAMFVWAGKPGYNPPKIVPLTAEQQKRFDEGKELFNQTCAGCHQPTGLGQEGLAPPLLNSEWLLGTEQRLARIVLNGVNGDINVDGRAYSMEMPPLNVLTDEQLAAIFTYARREWGHTAPPVEPATITKIRAATKDRGSWTAKDLMQVK
jgi:mono/diheme cytochrome c family protein/glucose/arabinose dehydrogenase